MLDLCYLPKLVTIQMFWKESLEQKAISVSVARRVEMQETRQKSSLKKELPPQWFCIQLLGCSHWKKQLRPNHNVFYEKLDKEGRLCLMLGSPKAECKMKIHMETLSQNNPVKEWGKQQRRGDSSSQVLWQEAWSWRKTLELRLCVRVLTWGTGSGLPNCYPLKSLAKATTRGTLALYTCRKRSSNSLQAGSWGKGPDKGYRRQKHTERE